MDYPHIIFNGVELTSAQAMAVHVALQDFGMRLENENKQEETDASTRELNAAYLANIRSINRLL